MRHSFLISVSAIAASAVLTFAGVSSAKEATFLKKIDVTTLKKASKNSHRTLRVVRDDGPSSQETVTLLKEDFMNFTAGSETTPDTTPIADATTSVIPSSYTSVAGWSGVGIYQAGGTCYIGKTGNVTGVLNTPSFDSSTNGGTFWITFRAKILDSTITSDNLVFVSINADNVGSGIAEVIDYKETAINYMWQTFTIEMTGGVIDNTVQIYAHKAPILIDNIEIKQVVSEEILPPTVREASDITRTSFTANWDAISNADSYLLNVWYNDEEAQRGNAAPVTETEGFDGLVAGGTKNKYIDEDDSVFPEGWTISLSENGSNREVYTTAGNYNSPSIALCFDATGDYIETPVVPEAITDFTFWIKNQGACGSGSKILFEGYNGTEWISIGEMDLVDYPTDLAEEVSWTVDGEDVYALRLTYSKEVGNVAIDDFCYTYGKIEEHPVYVLQDKEVKGTSYSVEGLDPNQDYYYNVRAKNGSRVSAASGTMQVFDMELEAPVAHEAENVTADGFEAAWDFVSGADGYILGVWRQHTALGTEDYQLFNSNFALWQGGTTSEPKTGTDSFPNNTLSLDGYGSAISWNVDKPAAASGMIGFALDNTGSGSITSDTYTTSATPGEVTIKFDAIGVKAERLHIAVLGSSGELSSTEVTLADYAVDHTVKLACSEKIFTIEITAVGEVGGYVLFNNLDASVSLTNKTTIEHYYYSVQTTDLRQYIDTKGIDPNDTFTYYVAAYSMKQGVISTVSGMSDLITVEGRNSSVSDLAAADSRIANTADGITVSCDAPQAVAVYSLDGRLVCSSAAAQSHDIALQGRGVYLVKVGAKTTKLVH